MAQFLDKPIEEWDRLVEAWHSDESTTLSLPEYMGLNEVEYMRYVHHITEPNLSDEEVLIEATKRTRQAVVGLTIQEILDINCE